MTYLFFFIYLFLLCWLLTKIKFIRGAQLGNRTIIILFLIRILAGLVNGWLNHYYFPFSDSLGFHREGIVEYKLMFSNTKEYLLNLFVNNTNSSYGAIFDITNSFWNNLRTNLIIKLLSLFNILSHGQYYINVLFYNFLVFFGSVALYKIFIQIFADKKNILLITVFLLPSFVYFTSGIHREGLIFLAIAFVCYHMFNILNKGASVRKLLYLFINLALIFLLRNFVFITLIPALTAWIIAKKANPFGLLTFFVVYGLFGIIFFSLKYLHPALDLPQYICGRQAAFVELAGEAGSAIHINPLFPHLRSFLNNSPQALNHILMRPYLTETKTILYIPAALELLICEFLLIIYLLFRYKKPGLNDFIYFGVFFTLTVDLLIGYTIPIIGAFARYRSPYFPFIVTPLCCLIDVKKLRSFIHYFKI